MLPNLRRRALLFAQTSAVHSSLGLAFHEEFLRCLLWLPVPSGDLVDVACVLSAAVLDRAVALVVDDFATVPFWPFVSLE